MKILKVFRNYLFYIVAFLVCSEINAQIPLKNSITIQQSTYFAEFGTVWIENVYLNIDGAKNLNLPYAYALDTTVDAANSRKSALITAIKTNNYGTIDHKIWNSSNDCSKTLFAYRHYPGKYVIVVVKVANTGNDDNDYYSGIYSWVANSKGASEAKVGVMLDRNFVKTSSDLVKVSAYISCPNNNFKSWVQATGDTTKQNTIVSSSNTHFNIAGIDKNTNIYLSCLDNSNVVSVPISFSPTLSKIDLKTTEGACNGTNRFITILPSGGAGKYEYLVDGSNPNDSNTSPSDPNHCNGTLDYLFFSNSTPPGQTGLSLTAGQIYNFRVRDAYQESIFPVNVSACSTACNTKFDWDVVSATKCGEFTTIIAKVKEANNSPFTAQFSLDKTHWFDANAEINQYRFTINQKGICRTIWARAKGCSDTLNIKSICLQDTDSTYSENCSEPCISDLNLGFDKTIVTTCANQSTFTVTAIEKNGYPFAAQFSQDKINWYSENAGTNKYRFSLIQNKTCRGIYAKPAGCQDNSMAVWACFNDTDPSYGYTENCQNPCGVNLLWDIGSATTCGNKTTFIIKVKEKNGFPFIAQFSADSLNWYDSNFGVNQYKFVVSQNKICKGFWARIKGCNDISKTIWACFQDTDSKYEIDCTNTLLAVEPDNISRIIISPNPVSDKLLAEIYLTNHKETFTLKINNSQGQELLSEIIDGKRGVNAINLDMKAFKNGIYFVSIQSKTNKIVKKILKFD